MAIGGAEGVGLNVRGEEGSGRIRGVLFALLVQAGDLLDRQSWLCVLLLLLCLLPLVVMEAYCVPLINDEIYTWHIAQAPTLRAMLALSREIDLHPPLHYLAQRAALHLPLARWLASRLPSIVAAVVACLALFRYTAARMGNVAGMVAVGVFWFGPVLDSAWVNRPYMMWMAWLCLLLLARDAAVRERRSYWALPSIFFLTLAMIMTHLIGIACVLPFVVAEAARAWRRKRVDYILLMALILPMLAGLGFFYQIHHLSENVFPQSQLPSFNLATSLYSSMAANAVWIVGGCAVGVTLLFGVEPGERVPSPGGLQREDFVLLLTLLALPLLLLVPAAVLHVQFWARYGVAAAPGFAVLTAWTVARRLPRGHVLGVVLVTATVAYMIQRMATEYTPLGDASAVVGGRSPIALSSLDADLPIVAASPMTYVEMSDRESPAIAKRVYYLTDRTAASEYAHYTLFENEDKIRQLLGLPSKTEDLTSFLQTHRRFYVVGQYSTNEVWLLRKLAADGLRLDYLGKFQSTYESDDLYEVTH